MRLVTNPFLAWNGTQAKCEKPETVVLYSPNRELLGAVPRVLPLVLHPRYSDRQRGEMLGRSVASIHWRNESVKLLPHISLENTGRAIDSA